MNQVSLIRDRRQLLLAPGAALNGIDYIEVGASPTRLLIHFLNTVDVRGSLSGAWAVTITGGEIVTGIAVNPVDERTAWSADRQGRPVLAVAVTRPGDFSTYRLAISSSKLDPFLSQAPFTFQAGRPSGTDCAAATPGGPGHPVPSGEQVPIDYLAKDFASFRQALSEFSVQRYPAWVERSEADLGVMLMEALAAMADELSYYQDRVLAEATARDRDPAAVGRPARAAGRLRAGPGHRRDHRPPARGVASGQLTAVDGLHIGADVAVLSVPWEPTGQRSTSRSRTRRSAWPAPSAPPGPPGQPSTLAGTGPASAASTTGTTASAACRRLDRSVHRRPRPGALPRPAAAARHGRGGQRRPSRPRAGHGLGDGGDSRPAARQPAAHRPDARLPVRADRLRP